MSARIASLLLVSLVSTAGLAQTAEKAPQTQQAKAGFQLRLDSVGNTKEVTGQKTQQTQSFVTKTARLVVSGDLSETLSYNLRLDVKNALFGTDSVGQDASIAALDRAYIEHRVYPGLALRIGRMPMMTGSLESDYSSMDRYYESYWLETVSYKVAPITTGIDLSYGFLGQTLTLQAFNGVQEGTGANKGQQKGENTSWAVGYRGNFLQGAIKPIVTYDAFSRIRNGDALTRDEKVTYTAWGVGSQFSQFGVDLDLEYDEFAKPAFVSYKWDANNVATKVQNKHETIKSVVGQIAYNWTSLGLRPFVKASQDKAETDGKESLTSDRNAAGVEYRPGPKGFRYHAVVVNKLDEATAQDAKRTTTKVRQYIVGVAAKI